MEYNKDRTTKITGRISVVWRSDCYNFGTNHLFKRQPGIYACYDWPSSTRSLRHEWYCMAPIVISYPE